MAEKHHNDADKTVYVPRHIKAEDIEEATSTQEADSDQDEAKPQKATSSKKTPAKSASTKKES